MTQTIEVNIIYLSIATLLILIGIIAAIINVFAKDIEYSKNYIRARFNKFLPYLLFVIAAVLVYLSAGNNLLSSMFNGIGCFLHVNTDYISNNNVRLMNTFATVVTLSVIVSNLRDFIKLFIYFIAEKLFNKEIYVVHGNSDTVKIIRHNFESCNKIVIEVDNKNEKFYHHFNNHIIAYDSEDKNMKVAVLINDIHHSGKMKRTNDEYNDELDEYIKIKEDKLNIYVLSSGCDSTLFMRNTINIIDKNDLSIKEFWKTYGKEIYDKLSDESDGRDAFKNRRITIAGTNEMAYSMYLHILKNCIYRCDQSININVLTNLFNKDYFAIADGTIKEKITNDTITIDFLKNDNVFDMQNSDIVIVTDKSLLSKVAIKYRYGQLIYLYDPGFNKDDYESSNIGKEEENYIRPFGADSTILTVDNITGNKDTEIAKLVNFGYCHGEEIKDYKEDARIVILPKKNPSFIYLNNKRKYNADIKYNGKENTIYISQADVDYEWDTIDKDIIYTVNSNYAVSDYLQFRKYICSDIKDEETLAMLEHIHWCRVTYLEGFKYNEIRNKKLKTHYDLRPFDPVKDHDELLKDIYIYSVIKRSEIQY